MQALPAGEDVVSVSELIGARRRARLHKARVGAPPEIDIVHRVNITVIGRGNVGGGLAALWRQAGHEVQELGRDGGDASGADVLVVAVPWREIADALAKVDGAAGKVTIDATNAYGGRPEEFESLAHQVKSIVGGPTVKSFNLNFATLYDQIAAQPERPGNTWAGDEEARDAVEQLSRDAGYEPVHMGGLENVRALEDFLPAFFAFGQGFYRFWKP